MDQLLKRNLNVLQAGVQIADPIVEKFNNQQVEVWPRITWHPKWGVTFADIRNQVSGTCSISQMSTMIIKGKNVFLKDLALDGTLIVNSEDDTVLKVGGFVRNKGWFLQHVDYKDDSVPEESRIRGFKIEKNEQMILESK